MWLDARVQTPTLRRMSLERIQKVLSRAGVASRRQAEQLMLEGRVRVNGAVVTELGTRVDPARDRIEVDDRPVDVRAVTTRVVALNKPRNIMVTRSDPEGRPTLYDLLPAELHGLYPVGRLDFGSEGLLLLTNDGDLAQALTHPRHAVPKTYRVKVRGRLDADDVAALAGGMVLDGRRTRPVFVEPVGPSRTGRNTWYEVLLLEGRRRQIRRMMERLGHPVMRLRRIAIGPLELGDLAPGRWRELDDAEVEALRRAAGGATSRPHRSRREPRRRSPRR